MQAKNIVLHSPKILRQQDKMLPWEVFFLKAVGTEKKHAFDIVHFPTSKESMRITLAYGQSSRGKEAGPALPLEKGDYYPNMGFSVHTDDLDRVLPVLANRIMSNFRVYEFEPEHLKITSNILQVGRFKVITDSSVNIWMHILISNANVRNKFLIFGRQISCDISICFSLMGQRGASFLDIERVAQYQESTETKKILNGESIGSGGEFRGWLEWSIREFEKMAEKLFWGLGILKKGVILLVNELK